MSKGFFNAFDDVVIVGMQSGGVWVAERIHSAIAGMAPGVDVPLGAVDVSMYRDDIALRPVVPAAPTRIPRDLTGATVVLVDSDPDSMNVTADAIAAAITPRTKAVMPVHFGGLAADMPALLDIARRHGLKVVEDELAALEMRWLELGEQIEAIENDLT